MISVTLSRGKKKDATTTEHAAISLVYQKRLGLFSASDIERLNITPPAAVAERAEILLMFLAVNLGTTLAISSLDLH